MAWKKTTSTKVKLSGTIDTTSGIVKITSTTEDQWTDFGYWLEATSFMAKYAMVDKGWSEDKMKKYVQKYLDKAFTTYSVIENQEDLYKPES